MNAFPLNANKGTSLENSGEGKSLILNILYILFTSVHIPQDCAPLGDVLVFISMLFIYIFFYCYLCVYIYIYVCIYILR